jgi:hypothetical protein
MKVYVRLEDGDRPLKVGDSTLAPGQATSFILDKDLTLRADDPGPASVDVQGPEDVWSPGNRPNGLVTAQIAPKIPKAGGETSQEPLDPGSTRATREVPVAELGRATQGGGPDSPDTLTTPGPQPDTTDQGLTAKEDKTGSAASPVPEKGKTVADAKTAAKK